MTDNFSSPIALAVEAGLKGNDPYLGSIMLRGYLVVDCGSGVIDSATDDAARAKNKAVLDKADCRLYIDDTFRTWYEFKGSALLHHRNSDDHDTFSPMSLVWIRSEARIKRATTGYAYAVTGGGDSAEGHKPGWGGGGHKPGWGMGDDPGGGHKPGWP